MSRSKQWTDNQVKRRDRIVQALINKHYPKREAFAIATATILQKTQKKQVKS